MQTIARVSPRGHRGLRGARKDGPGNTSECCERCHHVERYGTGLLAGPCRVALPDGRDAFVCCASKKRLLEREA